MIILVLLLVNEARLHLTSSICRLPFIPIHHMEAHALTARMEHKYVYYALENCLIFPLLWLFYGK